jgi:hypothetical protein
MSRQWKASGLSGSGRSHELALDGIQPGDRAVLMFAEESCNIYSKNDQWWEAGKSFYSGGTRRSPADGAGKFLKRWIFRPEKPFGRYPTWAGGF